MLRLCRRQVTRNWRRSSPVVSKWSIAFARRQLLEATAPRQHRPGLLHPPGEVLDRHPPQLALEHLRALVLVGVTGTTRRSTQAPAAAAAHRPTTIAPPR